MVQLEAFDMHSDVTFFTPCGGLAMAMSAPCLLLLRDYYVVSAVKSALRFQHRLAASPTQWLGAIALHVRYRYSPAKSEELRFVSSSSV